MGIFTPVKGLGDTQNPFSPSSQNPAIAITDKPTGGVIGTATTTVNVSSFGVITQTTAGQSVTLPVPANTIAARFFALKNDIASTTAVGFYGLTIAPGQVAIACYVGGAWATGSVALLGTDDVQCSKLSVNSPVAIAGSGTVNNLSVSGASSARLNPTAALTITGIVAPTTSQLLFLANISAFTVTVNDGDAASTAANRIGTGLGSPIELLPEAALMLQYDLTAARWRVIGGTGGASADKIQSVTTSSNIADWGSTLLANSSTATTQTLPTTIAREVGKKITIKNMGAGIVTPQAFGAESLTGIQSLAQGESLTITAIGVGSSTATSDRLNVPVNPEILPVWTATTAVVQYAERSIAIGGSTLSIVSNSSRTTGAAFTLAEAGNWAYTGQSTVNAFPSATVILSGFQVVDSGVTYQSNATRTTGATFDAAEQANWTPLSTSVNGNRVNISNIAASGQIGTATATVDTAVFLAFSH